MKQIVGILNCLVSRKETNMKDLYKQGNHCSHFEIIIAVSSFILVMMYM